MATRGQSNCRIDALPIARLTCDVGWLHHQLEHLIAVSDPIDLATPPSTSAEIVIGVGVRRGACGTPQITPASRR